MGKYDAKKKTTRSKSRQKDDDLERSYAALYGSKKKKKENSNALSIALCVLAVVLILGLVFAAGKLFSGGNANTVPAGLTAAGVNIGGLSRADAAAALHEATDTTYSRTPMEVHVGEDIYTLSPAVSGSLLDVNALLDKAMTLPAGDAQIMDILPYLNLDTTAIHSFVADLEARYPSDFVPARVDDSDVTMPETIDENTAIQTITVTVGRSGVSLAGLYDEMLTAYNNNVFTVSYDTAGQDPKDVDLDALWAKHCTAPVDAAEGSNGTITPAKYGYGFDLDDAKAALSAAGEGDMLTLTLKPIAPSVTAEELENQLFRDVLASCETPYDADETGRTTNLELACKAIDGLVLQPGDVFSYNDTLGERTEEKGYQLGPSYVNGEVVQEIGGGICQVSSTLYNCVLTADLEVLERENHMFYPGYVDPGLDCAVNWGTLDFRFRNSSGHAIRIEASLDGYNVTIKLLSTDDKDYYVKMEYDILRTYDFNTYYRDLDEDNAEGYRNGDTIVDGVEGYYVETYRCRYDKETNALRARVYETSSMYDARDAVIACITTPETTEPPNIIIGGGVHEDPGG